MDDTRRILVVDDDREIRDMVREYLTEEGFQVSEAGDGETMYRILENEPIDLVILDIRLPGDDGLTLAAELHWKMPVGILMLSSKDELVDKVAGLEVGADDYIVKPFHLRELLARVPLRSTNSQCRTISQHRPGGKGKAAFRGLRARPPYASARQAGGQTRSAIQRRVRTSVGVPRTSETRPFTRPAVGFRPWPACRPL